MEEKEEKSKQGILPSDVLERHPKEKSLLENDNHPTKRLVTFEDVLEKMGGVGKYQYIQCTVCLSATLLVAFMHLGFVIIGYTPPHVCRKINETEFLLDHKIFNDSNIKISYKKCDITVHRNQSGRMEEIFSTNCPNGHHFPGGKQMTLVSEWDLVCERTGQAEIAQLMFTLGNIIGGLIIPYIADRYGRKPVFCVTSIINMAIEFAIAFAPNMYFVCGALLVDGISYGGVGSTCIVLGMEILSARYRQAFGIIVCQFWVGCILIVALTGYLFEGLGWRYFQATGALTGLLTLAMPFVLYESPRWLAINGKANQALDILRTSSKQNGVNFSDVKKIFEKYMADISSNKKNQLIETNDESVKNAADSQEPQETLQTHYSLFSMLRRKDTLVLLLVIWYLWTTCNITYYGIYISSSDLAGNRFLNFALMAIVEIPANFLVLYTMNRMGRLHVMRIFISLSTLSLLSSLLLATFQDDSQAAVTATVILFIFGKFAVTCFFNALYIVTPEIFPTVLRSSGTGSCKSIPKMGSMLAPYSRPLFAIAKWAPGTIFTSMCFIAFFVSFILPETKDKILPTKLKDVGTNKIWLDENESKKEEL